MKEEVGFLDRLNCALDFLSRSRNSLMGGDEFLGWKHAYMASKILEPLINEDVKNIAQQTNVPDDVIIEISRRVSKYDGNK